MKRTLHKSKAYIRHHPRKVALFLVFCAIIAIIHASGILQYTSFAGLLHQRDLLKHYAENHQLLAYGAYFGVFVLSLCLLVPVAASLTFFGALILGFWPAVTLVIAASLIGCSAVFIGTRSFLGRSMEKKNAPLWQKVKTELQQNAVGYMLFMRMFPLMPITVTNIAPAVVNMPFRVYFFCTAIGILPSTFIYANLGNQFADIQSTADLWTSEVLIALSLPATLALAALFGRNHLRAGLLWLSATMQHQTKKR